MALNHIGDIGIYLPDSGSIKFTALDRHRVVACYAMESALDALGCTPRDGLHAMVARFEEVRPLLERLADIKHRAAPHYQGGSFKVEIDRADLDSLSGL
jgi:hypothetical protein